MSDYLDRSVIHIDELLNRTKMKVIVATMFYDDGDRDVRVFANEAGL
jgi:hypothetical protein